MSNRFENRNSSRHDLIDDIVEAPATTNGVGSNSSSSFNNDPSRSLPNRTYSSYSSIPTLFNNKGKNEKSSNGISAELRDRLQLTLPRSNSSSTMMTNDERRRELDLLLKHLHDGKLLTQMNDDRALSETSEPSTPVLTKAPITTTSSIGKTDEDNRINLTNLEVPLVLHFFFVNSKPKTFNSLPFM